MVCLPQMSRRASGARGVPMLRASACRYAARAMPLFERHIDARGVSAATARYVFMQKCAAPIFWRGERDVSCSQADVRKWQSRR